MDHRIFGLDLLRALAIVFVVLRHGLSYFQPHFNTRPLTFFLLDGVSVFFVLSGFLIGQILIKRISTHGGGFSQLRQFWVRRWFRTLPNYFLVLLVVLSLSWYYRGYTPIEGLPFFVFLQNFAWPHPPVFPEAWSLSVEEWFYLVFPICSFFLFKTKDSLKHGFPWLIFSFILFSVLLRHFRFETVSITSFREWDLLLRKQVVTRFDSLMLGILGSWFATFYAEKWQARSRLKMIIGILLLVVNQLAFYYAKPIFGGVSWYHAVPSFLIFAIGIFMLLPSLSGYTKSKSRLAPAITKISLVSYSLYLLHYTFTKGFVIPLTMRGALAESTFILDTVRFIIYLAFSTTASILLYKFYERPTTQWRDRFSRKKQDTIN